LNIAYEDLLAKHVPPSLLVDEYYELVHCFGEARKLLSPPEGKPSNDVIKMLEKDLGVAVTAALHRAKSEGIPITFKGVRVTVDEDDQRLYRVTVEPYRKTDRSLYLISLEETNKAPLIDQVVEEFDASHGPSQRVEQLERELNYTRETLQATVEELESSNEELQATNEEMVASNEELQSTNEELHSVNEELYTVNAEHQEKITELTNLTVDMDNLLNSTEIGTIFLDENFAIRMFTPSITAGFNVLEQDIGRSINDIAYKLDNPNLLADTAEVLSSGVPMESEVCGNSGKIYLQRIQPYKDDKGEVAGIVLTLTDITAIREAEFARSTMQTLTDISQELPDFAYAVSHDFQAPLRHISQYTQVLESAIEAGDEKDIKKSSQVIKTSSETMRTMMEGLLAYSRINTQGGPLEKLDLAAPVYDAIHNLRIAIEGAGAEVVVEPDLPEVVGDSRQLQELFFQLIDNSLKYCSDAKPVIKIGCEVEDGVATVSVSDNGIGVPDRDSERIFSIFKRLGFKEEVRGAGVGLAICRRIVLRHQGQISLVASSDAGSTIQFVLRTPMLIEQVPQFESVKRQMSAKQKEV
jgi:two-component system CheB/CheR fusion protein